MGRRLRVPDPTRRDPYTPARTVFIMDGALAAASGFGDIERVRVLIAQSKQGVL